MNIRVLHNHTKEEAKRRVEALFFNLKDQYGSQIQNLKEQWADYTGTLEGSAKGYSILGTIEIKAIAVSVDVKIPIVLKIFGKKIRSAVEEHLKKALS